MNMKKILKYLVIAFIIVVAGGWVYLSYFMGTEALSPDQQEIVDTFGYPKRFSISYVQYAEEGDDMLVRQEMWYYPDHRQSMAFLGGDILSVDEIGEEISDGGEITYSSLKPENFEFEMDYDAVVTALDTDTVEAADMVPELYTEGELETYISDHVYFTLEHGHLTYIETVGLDEGEEEEE